MACKDEKNTRLTIPVSTGGPSLGLFGLQSGVTQGAGYCAPLYTQLGVSAMDLQLPL